MRATLPAVDVSDVPFALAREPAVIVVDLPAPLSVNRLRKIDWSSSKRKRGWTKAADAMMLGARCRSRNPIRHHTLKRFELLIVLSEAHTKIDLDNSLKWLIDYLRRVELIIDDGPQHMRRLVVEWGLAPQGCRVTLTEVA